MEKFLQDYGLKWVGDNPIDNKMNMDALKKELSHEAPLYRGNLPMELDTEVLTRRIEELNFIAEK